MIIDFLIQIPALLISLFALVYAIRAHKLNLHINNEHILSEHKLQSAKEVLYALNDLMNSIQSGFYLVKATLESNSTDKDSSCWRTRVACASPVWRKYAAVPLSAEYLCLHPQWHLSAKGWGCY